MNDILLALGFQINDLVEIDGICFYKKLFEGYEISVFYDKTETIKSLSIRTNGETTRIPFPKSIRKWVVDFERLNTKLGPKLKGK